MYERVPNMVNLDIIWSCTAMKKKDSIGVLTNIHMVDPKWMME